MANTSGADWSSSGATVASTAFAVSVTGLAGSSTCATARTVGTTGGWKSMGPWHALHAAANSP
eukprot:CAMPEP_0183812212 /NCGR_PEP_ID=MMETSP0803_2-20130417/50785_1 /TAXON_ID=195967 /ORGANISM="Crustomastix stigmata, Strain CCMP3273" /LENGTH=62 /DNA_ID=CAMNT_0026057053 /DNA_START=106 /DNA_END=290 /DNA_ORIENTATION=+